MTSSKIEGPYHVVVVSLSASASSVLGHTTIFEVVGPSAYSREYRFPYLQRYEAQAACDLLNLGFEAGRASREAERAHEEAHAT